MGKLRLKRTPEDQRRHDLRKAQKAARKAAKRARDAGDSDVKSEEGPSSKRRRTSSDESYLFEFNGCDPSSPRRTRTKDDVYAQMEEERFREKMWGAFTDDERLDSVEAAFSSYAHIPRRWRSGGMDRMDDENDIDPHMMEDEDYAEWFRLNMWRAECRRKHAAEAAAYDRSKQEKAARKERERKIREETRRMEKAEEERRRQRRREKENKQWDDARTYYEATWKQLLDGKISRELRFEEVPWPVLFTKDVHVEAITVDAISTFLLSNGQPMNSIATDRDAIKKERKDKLKETMLRFHPDKFEGRILRHVREADQRRVLEGVGMVARGLNTLLSQ
ncbi:uncharacterized protein PHACADRAFT_175997 [Phanerochaete carnosa HHB-10118-sp]|uniref:Uncharacterized protein n=1 Tax=Phanerochaete carnosa (strain HHB-10118-sp) TaxID=650164 RepID=K5WT31_PHACS|nr:uncharacterized protein PHACADRAFT_175997 [Phanerochaete carnosa HHB-10118-sp]EKM53587.1 hypothetical protein PHACADRAFT_175997 [Phanerochaete carnosa HHB-10118-sp]